MKKFFKIVWYDIDDPEKVENTDTWGGDTPEEAEYDFTYDCSGSGVDIHVVSVTAV